MCGPKMQITSVFFAYGVVGEARGRVTRCRMLLVDGLLEALFDSVLGEVACTSNLNVAFVSDGGRAEAPASAKDRPPASVAAEKTESMHSQGFQPFPGLHQLVR